MHRVPLLWGPSGAYLFLAPRRLPARSTCFIVLPPHSTVDPYVFQGLGRRRPLDFLLFFSM